MDIKAAFSRGKFAELAESIDTGTDDPDTSRALVVFNTSAEPISGFVLFRVDMPWRSGRELPPLLISHLETGRVCRHIVRNLAASDGRLKFDLFFETQDIPLRGWDTYTAAYTSAAAEAVLGDRVRDSVDESRYALVETLRHGGELAARGSADSPCR